MKDQKETIESNEKINTFMGFHVYNDHRYGRMFVDPSKENGLPKVVIGMRYHESWDWLMPVVIVCETVATEKINELSDNTLGLDDPGSWRAWDYRRVHLSSNIDDTYKSVLDFIDWHKTHNPQPL